MSRAPRADLLDIYRRLRRHFGHQSWWPGDSPFEVIVGAVLTQRTAWRNVEQAIQNLKRAKALTAQAISSLPAQRLATLLRPAGYFNQKAARLKAICNYLLTRGDGDVAPLKRLRARTLRRELLAISGIGPETADSILLYALGKPVFVVDAYTCRALERIGIKQPSGNDYNEIQASFHQNLPRRASLYNDYHAQWVTLGKRFCRTKPLCAQCPLIKVCNTGKAQN